VTTSTRSPGIGEVLEDVRETTAADIRSCCVARVVRWDHNKPREVDVQPVHKRAYRNEDGDRVTDKQPIIPSVPVVYPGGGGFTVTWPLAVGDEVLLVFSDDSLDKYLQVGGQGDIDPEDDRRHHLTDAICIPGIGKLTDNITASTSAVKIGTRVGPHEGAALGNTLTNYFNDGLAGLLTWLGSHTHSGVTTGPGNSGAPVAGPPALPTIESATVRVSK
jgi:hypothetical protein